MNKRQVDVAVIGAGTSGLNARREVSKAGKSVLMIEDGPYGTTCARVGCMPSKLLIAAADAAHHVATASLFGVHAQAEIDGPAVLRRVRAERDRFVGFVIRGTEEIDPEQRLRGRARFVGPTTLQVDEHTLVEAGAVVIASGSSPFVPPPFAAIREHIMVNDDLFELSDLPESVAVIGTGIIGLELGQALHRLGVRTAFFNPRKSLGPFTDPALYAKTREVLSRELDLRLETDIVDAVPVDGGVQLRFREADGVEHTELFEKVLVAAGRRANLDLDLDEAGLSLSGPLPWNASTTQLGELPIFLAGDASGHRPLLHEAGDEGRIAGANAALYPEVVVHERRVQLAIAFTDPQIAIVGTPFAELPPGEHAVGEVSYDDQGRARVMGQNAGVVRIYADREDRILGAEMFGPRVEHTAHLLAWIIQRGTTVQQALQLPFYHPVIEEGIRTALRDLAKQLDAVADCRPEDFADAAGT